MAGMVMPLPARGGVLFDARYPDRTCRISWHPDKRIFSISIWHDATCLATFHLPPDRVSDLISTFVTPLIETAALPEAGSQAFGG